MDKNILKSQTVFILVSLVLVNFVCLSFSKQPMRISNGLECTEPGYFRDVSDCKRFYFCPFPVKPDKEPILTEEEKVEWKDFMIKGMLCPKGMFFDELTSFCESFTLASIIPAECHYPDEMYDHFEHFRDSTTGNIPELLRNNQ